MFMKLKKILNWYKLNKFKKAGLQIADDCRLIGIPSFGSEPYLISIGSHVTISGNVTFLTHDGAPWVFRDLPKYNRVMKFGKIVIKDNCFIGYGSIIMPGVTIGTNSVVGAGSIVTKDVPPNTVVAGNPAKFITTTEEYAEKLLKSTPNYDYELYKINKKSEILRIHNV